jgi:hypothetical protein
MNELMPSIVAMSNDERINSKTAIAEIDNILMTTLYLSKKIRSTITMLKFVLPVLQALEMNVSFHHIIRSLSCKTSINIDVEVVKHHI